MRRVAVIVTHANEEPYKSILEGIERPSSFQLDEFAFDLYYVEGRRKGNLESRLRKLIEGFRYSTLWPLLRIYDTFILRRAASHLPEAQLISESNKREFLRVDTPEDQRHIAIKVYSAIKFCQSQNYEFLIRTTSNSIVNLRNVVKIMSNSIDDNLLYAGREVKRLDRPSFVSGSFLILNRAAMNYLMSSRQSHNYGDLDDVAIGKVFDLQSTKVAKQFVKSLDFTEVQSVFDLSIEELREATHYRCKTKSIPRSDLQVMNLLIQTLRRAGIEYV